jgi:hypothetical protein
MYVMARFGPHDGNEQQQTHDDRNVQYTSGLPFEHCICSFKDTSEHIFCVNCSVF